MVGNKVCFRDLSLMVKVAVVSGWIGAVLFLMGFLKGFLFGFLYS